MRVAAGWPLVLSMTEVIGCRHQRVSELTPAQHDAILGAVLSSLDRSLITNAPICLAIARESAWVDADTTASWTRSSRRRVTTRTQCPPTYETMVLVVDSAGQPIPSQRPPGYVDPYYVTVWGPARLARDLYVVRYQQSQGTGGVFGLCEVIESPSGVRAACSITAHFVS